MSCPIIYYVVQSLQKIFFCAQTFSFLKILFIFTFLSLGVFGILDGENLLDKSANKKIKERTRLVFKIGGLFFISIGVFYLSMASSFIFTCQNIFEIKFNLFYYLLFLLILIYFFVSISFTKDKKIKRRKFIIFIVESILIGLSCIHG